MLSVAVFFRPTTIKGAKDLAGRVLTPPRITTAGIFDWVPAFSGLTFRKFESVGAQRGSAFAAPVCGPDLERVFSPP